VNVCKSCGTSTSFTTATPLVKYTATDTATANSMIVTCSGNAVSGLPGAIL